MQKKTSQVHTSARAIESTGGRVENASGRNAEERVYDAVLEAILDHRLAPGTKLVEHELSQILGASRGAVRNALMRLNHDLLVELRPNRGAIIANPSLEEAKDIFDSRNVIEAAIVRKVAENMTPATLKRLQEFLSDEKEAYIQGELSRAQGMSRQFHIVLAEIADNKILKGYLENLIARQPLLVLAHVGSRLQYCGAHEHESILTALARGDGETAVRCMLTHLATLQGQLLQSRPETTTNLTSALSRSGDTGGDTGGITGGDPADLNTVGAISPKQVVSS